MIRLLILLFFSWVQRFHLLFSFSVWLVHLIVFLDNKVWVKMMYKSLYDHSLFQPLYSNHGATVEKVKISGLKESGFWVVALSRATHKSLLTHISLWLNWELNLSKEKLPRFLLFLMPTESWRHLITKLVQFLGLLKWNQDKSECLIPTTVRNSWPNSWCFKVGKCHVFI